MEIRKGFVILFCIIGLGSAQTCHKQSNSDIISEDIASFNDRSETECCGLCSQTPGCQAYSWTDYEGGTCWLKADKEPISWADGVSVGVIDGDFPEPTFKVLAFYHGNYDLAHISFCEDANRYFPAAASQYGFTFESTTDWTKMNDAYLSNYDVILWLDGQPWDSSQRSAFQRFVEGGGGWMGFHVSAFTSNTNDWPWYHNTFLGSGNFERNTWGPTSATLQVEVEHPATANVPNKWPTQPNEWYAWENDLRENPDIDILLSIHEDSFPLGTDPSQTWYSGYFPAVWSNRNFRMIYVNMGHNDMDYAGGSNLPLSHTFDSPTQNQFIIDGLKWLAGQSKEKSVIHPLFKAFSR